jgi:hypothetical protein
MLNLRRIAVSSLLLLFGSLARAQVSFFQPPSFPGLGTVYVADFNGDGKLDILDSSGTLSLGNGDGTFKPGTPVSTTAQIRAVGDFNGDGRVDLLELTTGTLLVQLGNGDGTFQAPISTPSGASLTYLAAVDLNGDGKTDVIGISGSNLIVYLSKGDGTFVPGGVAYPIGAVPATGGSVLTIGDFNGDKKPDIAVNAAGTSSDLEIVFLGNGDGTLQAPKSSVGPSTYGLSHSAAADFNGDGKLDLALSSDFQCDPSSTNCTPNMISILFGNGDGTFQSSISSLAGSGPLVAADVNGDGKAALILQPETVGQGDSSVAEVFLSNGNGTFANSSNYLLSLPTSYPPGEGTTIVVGDFNNDGKLDIAANNAILLGNGDGTFQGIPFRVAPVSPSIVVGKFDNKGLPGAALISGQSVYVLANDGAGKLSLSGTYSLPGGYGRVEGATRTRARAR